MENDNAIRQLRKAIEFLRKEGYMNKEIVAYICLALNRSDNDDEFADALHEIVQESKVENE